MRNETMYIFGATSVQMTSVGYHLQGVAMTDGGKLQAGFAAGVAASGGNRPAIGERLSDVAYKAILQGLFDQKVPAGAFVSQNDLVRLLGIPVQPLRDALRVLEAEGVLTIHPRSGIQFLKPDLELARST